MDTHWTSLIFLASRQFWALSQSLCRPEETLEVVKEKTDNAFTCTYLPSNVLILWNLKVPNLSPQPELPISSCEISTKDCQVSGYPEIFSANITDTKSVINANTVSLNPVNSFLFERGILICETRSADSVPGPKVECQLDYICLTLPQCVGNKAAIELDENKSNQVITCTDVRAIDVVTVARIDANNVKTFILKCDTSYQCSENAENNIYSAMRGSNVVNVTIIVSALRSFFGGSTVLFEATNGNNTDERKCDLDVVYKPNMVSCNAQFITNRSEGIVIGKCLIDKVFSFRDRYACMWNEINGMLTTAIPSNQTTLNKTLISGTSRDNFYYSVECSFSKPLPEMSGNYSYTVIVYPGDMHLTINFTGSNSIGAPRILPNSTMPKEITFYGEPVPVIFEVIAYPKITEAYIRSIDNASNMISSDVNMKFPLMCDESSLLYTTVCILVITNATSADVGTYQMTLINGIGDLTINIKIFVNIKDQCACGQQNRDEGLSPGAGAGITLAVEAVVAAFVMVILWRKGFIFNCRDKHAGRSIKTNSEMADCSNMKSDMQVESCLDLPTMSSETGTNSQYEGLRVGEIGLALAYESIKQETKCRAETGHVYDNS